MDYDINNSVNRAAAILIGLLVFSTSLTGCIANAQPPPPGLVPWSPADMRVLDAPDASEPAEDLIAGYARLSPYQLQIRLDILDIATSADYDLYLAIDDRPGGKDSLPDGTPADIAWDRLIYLPHLGQTLILSSENIMVSESVLAIRNPVLDFVELSMQANSLSLPHSRWRFQAFSSAAGSATITDIMEPFSLQGRPPARAKTLLAFWNTLPAYSPAQALRRWDGAHTGPLGGRHGLGNLLKAARDYRTPVVLLDIKSISSLAALDFLDQVETLKAMADHGLVILPDVIYTPGTGPVDDLPSSLVQRTAATSRQVSLEFGLPATQFIYGAPTSEPGDRYRFQFLPTNPAQRTVSTVISSTPYRFAGQVVLPIPENLPSTQTTLDGPSLEIRRALVQAALESDSEANPAIIVLGGDLTRSTWGDPQHAAATLRYLTQQPWIKLLNTHDLLTTSPAQGSATEFKMDSSYSFSISDKLNKSLNWISARPNVLAENAWQAFLANYAPASPRPAELPALRRIYLNQVNTLAEAARWSQQPQPISRCDIDPDLDSQNECILASNSQFLVFEIDSGALVYAFTLRAGRAHQWIAPTSQFVSGLSDPALWEMDRGLSADPAVTPGAFSDAGPFEASIQPGEVTFSSADLTKTFTLLADGMTIKYLSSQPSGQRIPLAIDPWRRFQPDWEELYASDQIPGGIAWGIPGDFQVAMNSDANLLIEEFTASRQVVKIPENPNRDYPAGHFEIFPLAVVNIATTGAFEVAIHFLPEQGSEK